MKEIKSVSIELFHVISEPEDAARYDYFVYQNENSFRIMPGKSTCRFPQRLDYSQAKRLSDENPHRNFSDNLLDFAEKEKCNPNTLLECIRTVVKIYEEQI